MFKEWVPIKAIFLNFIFVDTTLFVHSNYMTNLAEPFWCWGNCVTLIVIESEITPSVWEGLLVCFWAEFPQTWKDSQ